MKKYGFTLVELMGVIMILGVIALIAIPVVDRQLKESKNDLHQTQKENIKEAAKLWTAKNIYKLPADGESCYIKYSDLVDGGFLDEKLKDPKTNTTFSDNNVNIKIEKDSDYNKYTYDVIIGSNSDDKVYCTDIVIVTFDANGGKLDVDSKPVAYHSTYGELPTPTKEGYTFLGWNGKNLINILDYNDSFNNRYYNDRTSNPKYILVSSTNYTLSFNYVVNSASNSITSSVGYGSSAFQRDIGSTPYSNTNGKLTYTFNTPSSFNYDPPYVWFRFVRMGAPGNANVDISNIQLEQGSTATEYEPYYITSSTTVVQKQNHTLTAVWQKND